MKKINIIISSLLLVTSLLVSSIHAEEPSSKSEFKQAYTSYQSLSEAGQWDEALPHAKKAYELGQSLYADKPETQAALADNYGLNLLELNHNDLAVPVLSNAVSLYEGFYGVDAPELMLPLLDLSRSLAKAKAGKAFNNNIERAVQISELHHGANSAEHGQMLVETALIYSKTRQTHNVKRHLEKGHKILFDTLGEKHPRTGIAAYNLGLLENAKRNYRKSTDYLESALKSFVYPDKPSNPYEMTTHGLLVNAYEFLKQSDKATKHCLAIGRMTPRTEVQDYFPLVKIAPIYPARAAERGDQGEVTVEFDVDESGFVINPVILDNNTRSRSLGKASIEAVLKFRYAPGFVDGEPVVTKGVKNRFTYRME